MKSILKQVTRISAMLLLLSLCLSAFFGCEGAGNSEDTTAPAEKRVVVDETYRVVITAEADDLTRKAADLVVSSLKEKAGLELSVVTDAEAPVAHEIVLGATNRAYSTAALDTYNVFFGDEALHVSASDSNRLYFAVEAVLDTWLTADFGLAEAGHVVLAESRLADLNGLALRLDNSIKIMTQNVRGSENDGDGLSVPTRLDRFLQMIADVHPDVIGTQEFSYTYSRRLHQLIENGGEEYGNLPYAVEECSVDGVGKRSGGWNAVIYSTERFERLDGGTFWLSTTPDVPSGYEVNHKRVCTWVLLKDKKTGETILFANTHLDHRNNLTRVQQITILLEQLADKIGDYPVFLTGDFNCGRGSEPYNIVSEVFTDSRTSTWADNSTVKGTYHGYNDQAFSEIDFVFHNEHSTPLRYEVFTKKYDSYVSDHYGVLVEFVLN